MWFYGAIEQLLSGWIFELIPGGGRGLRPRPARCVVATICGGLERRRRARSGPAMWESLATTRRQDRVLHGAAKALNVVVGLLALPLWLIGQRLGGPVPPAARRGSTPGSGRAADARAAGALDGRADGRPRGDPARPHHSAVAEPRKGLRDLSTFVLPRTARGGEPRLRLSARSSSITSSRAPTASGSPPRWALHEGGARPGLIVVHGLFSSRRFDYVREIAVHAFYEWGFNVAALDLRSFGLTDLTSEAPTTGGLEGGRGHRRRGPISEAARGDHGRRARNLARRVFGARRMPPGRRRGGPGRRRAGHLAARRPEGDGQADLGSLPRTDPAYLLNLGFWAMLKSRVRQGRLAGGRGLPRPDGEGVGTLLRGRRGGDLAAGRRPEPHRRGEGAGADPASLRRRGDPRGARDDARRGRRGNDLVRVWVLPGGGHGAIDVVDRRWFYAVLRGFFERWAGYGGVGDGANDGSLKTLAVQAD